MANAKGIRIEDEAAIELERRWADRLDRIGFHQPEQRLVRSRYQSDPRKRKLIEDAAIQETIRHFRALGFEIHDRQSESVGWDLEARKGDEHLLLEVKGLSGASVNVELTPNEYSNMQSHRANYAVYIVVDAIGPSRSLSVFRFDRQIVEWVDDIERRLAMTELIGARLTAGLS